MGLLKNTPRLWTYAAVIIAGLSIVLMPLMGAYAVYKVREVNHGLCEATEETRKIMRDILIVNEEAELEQAEDLEESIQIREKTDKLLTLIPPLDCHKSGGPVELEP